MMCKLVQNLLVIVVLKKSKLKKYIDTKKKKKKFQFLYTWESTKHFSIQRTTYET